MHQALLVDEILEIILDECTNATLSRVARCCKAWKDPALDRLWGMLKDGNHLMNLLPKESVDTLDNAILSTFWSYATRVKHVIYFDPPPAVLPDNTSLLLKRVRSANLVGEGCYTSPRWWLSPNMKDLTINIGGLFDDPESRKRGSYIASCLKLMQRYRQETDPEFAIEKLHLRGWMAPELNEALSTLSSIRFMTLQTMWSLEAQTLASLASFPHLEQLDVQAASVDAEGFCTALPLGSAPFFPSLHNLRIRGRPSLLIALSTALPSGVLRSLRLESDRREQKYPDAWKTICSILAPKLKDTLTNLEIDVMLEDTYNTDEVPSIGSIYSIDQLASLGVMRNLRRFTINSWAPPAFTDQDITTLATWWPLAEDLQLGVSPNEGSWKPSATPAALLSFAKHCPKLEKLLLPIDLTIPIHYISEELRNKYYPGTQHCLKRVEVGHSAPSGALVGFLQSVLNVFPALRIIDFNMPEDWLTVDAPRSARAGSLVLHASAGTADE